MIPDRVQRVSWNEASQALSEIRYEVFVAEQQVPIELEIDALDPQAIHALITDPHGKPVATGRLLKDGKIGRMAVKKTWRCQGLGAEILQCLSRISREELGLMPYLEAQISAIAFYERYGFVAEGEEYLDAGILHRLMRYQNTQQGEATSAPEIR